VHRITIGRSGESTGGRSLASGAVGGRARDLSAVTVTLARPHAPPGVSSREVVASPTRWRRDRKVRFHQSTAAAAFVWIQVKVRTGLGGNMQASPCMMR
jgi:hypothetical protein